jgi:glycosyltransferase involved in cell wall biosynthesis
MPKVLSSANIVVLPSYHEGLPKVLLEAAASARAIVATDVPGCREIVRQEVNGLLVPPRSSGPLARAIQVLLQSSGLRARFGRAGREIALSEFSERIVVSQTLDLYRDLLESKWPKAPVALPQ